MVLEWSYKLLAASYLNLNLNSTPQPVKKWHKCKRGIAEVTSQCWERLVRLGGIGCMWIKQLNGFLKIGRSKQRFYKKLIFSTFNGFQHNHPMNLQASLGCMYASAPVPRSQAWSLFRRCKRPAQLVRPEISKRCSIDTEIDNLSLRRSLFAISVYIRRRIRPKHSHWIAFSWCHTLKTGSLISAM